MAISRLFKCRIDESYPSLLEVFIGIVVMAFYDDFVFYWIHRLIHHPRIYSKIHKKHHEFYNVFHLVCIYAHPIEFIFGNILPAISGMLVFGSHFHFNTFLTFISLRTYETHEGHSGYEFKHSMFRINPFATDSTYHNYHHLKNLGNYGSLFAFWDTLFETNKVYLEHENK